MHRHKSLHLSLFVQTITSLGVNVTICYSVSVLTGLTSFTKVDFIAGIVVLHCIRCICNSVDVACLPTVFNNDRLNIQKNVKPVGPCWYLFSVSDWQGHNKDRHLKITTYKILFNRENLEIFRWEKLVNALQIFYVTYIRGISSSVTQTLTVPHQTKRTEHLRRIS